MRQTCKGKQWQLGMKVHIGVDKHSVLIHPVATAAANVHDLTPAVELLHGEEKVVTPTPAARGLGIGLR